MTGLLFDLGGTFLRAGLAGSQAHVQNLQKTRIPSVANDVAEPLIWRHIAGCMLAYERSMRPLLPSDAPVVISFPGPVEGGRRVLQAPTVAGLCRSSFDLPGVIERATGRPVAVLNDVSAAAWRVSELTSARRFLVVTVSSGIGSKIFDRCHPAGVIDEPAYAGEIGHVAVEDGPEATACDCGGRGHLGAIASGRGIERLVRRRALAEPRAFAASLLSRGSAVRPDALTNEEHIVPAFLAGDEWTVGMVRASTRPLVRSLLTVAMAAGLEKVFVMGGFANALGQTYIDLLSETAGELSGYTVAQPYLRNLFEGLCAHPETSLEGCAAYLRYRGRAGSPRGVFDRDASEAALEDLDSADDALTAPPYGKGMAAAWS